MICAGSATQSGLWSYSDYTLTGNRLKAVQRVFQPRLDQFADADSFELDLGACEPGALAPGAGERGEIASRGRQPPETR